MQLRQYRRKDHPLEKGSYKLVMATKLEEEETTELRLGMDYRDVLSGRQLSPIQSHCPWVASSLLAPDILCCPPSPKSTKCLCPNNVHSHQMGQDSY